LAPKIDFGIRQGHLRTVIGLNQHQIIQHPWFQEDDDVTLSTVLHTRLGFTILGGFVAAGLIVAADFTLKALGAT
jgi:hypothetical protein